MCISLSDSYVTDFERLIEIMLTKLNFLGRCECQNIDNMQIIDNTTTHIPSILQDTN